MKHPVWKLERIWIFFGAIERHRHIQHAGLTYIKRTNEEIDKTKQEQQWLVDNTEQQEQPEVPLEDQGAAELKLEQVRLDEQGLTDGCPGQNMTTRPQVGLYYLHS